MNGIIYTRVSSDEQTKGTSLESQEETCLKYCKERKISVVKIFREEGASAKTANRKVLIEAIEFCRKNNGKINHFIVAKVDRFARNAEDHFSVRAILKKYGVTLTSVSEAIDDNPAGKFMETILAATAEFDNSLRRQRCSDGMAQRIKNGIWPYKPPTGYVCKRHKKSGEKKNVPDEPDPEIFPIIQRGLKEFSKGTICKNNLAKLLDKWGLAKIRGKATSNQMIDKITKDHLKYYAGILHSSFDKIDYPGLHTPMITKEEYENILLVNAGKISLAKREVENPTFPLRRTVICADCGTPMTASAPKGRKKYYNYYHCYKSDCPSYAKSISQESMEKQFADFLEEFRTDPRFMKSFVEVVRDVWHDEEKRYSDITKKQTEELRALEGKRSRICDIYESGGYSEEMFKQRCGQIDNQIATIKTLVVAQNTDDEININQVLGYVKEITSSPSKKWQSLDRTLRPRFQKIIFPEGVTYNKNNGFGTAVLGLTFEINQVCCDKKSLMVDL